jgi:hypothetical protein
MRERIAVGGALDKPDLWPLDGPPTLGYRTGETGRKVDCLSPLAELEVPGYD